MRATPIGRHFSHTQNDCPQLRHGNALPVIRSSNVAHTGFVHEPKLTQIARNHRAIFLRVGVLHDVSYLITWRPQCQLPPASKTERARLTTTTWSWIWGSPAPGVAVGEGGGHHAFDDVLMDSGLPRSRQRPRRPRCPGGTRCRSPPCYRNRQGGQVTETDLVGEKVRSNPATGIRSDPALAGLWASIRAQCLDLLAFVRSASADPLCRPVHQRRAYPSGLPLIGSVKFVEARMSKDERLEIGIDSISVPKTNRHYCDRPPPYRPDKK